MGVNDEIEKAEFLRETIQFAHSSHFDLYRYSQPLVTGGAQRGLSPFDDVGMKRNYVTIGGERGIL